MREAAASLVAVVVAAAAAAWLVDPLTRLASTKSLASTNYSGRSSPRSLGLVVFASYLAGAAVRALAGGGQAQLPYLAVVGGMGLLGLADDVLGEGEHGGLRAHARALVRGRTLTSGGLKAVGGAMVALTLTSADRGWAAVFDVGLVALGANAVNLFDVRPGRALKFFWFTVALSALVGMNGPEMWTFAPLLVVSVMVARWDLRAEAMLGDTGANALGAAAGLFAARSLDLVGRAAMLGLLVLVHGLAEFTSLSRLGDRAWRAVRGLWKAGSVGVERNSSPPDE